MVVYEIAEMRDDSGKSKGIIEAEEANRKFFSKEILSSQRFFCSENCNFELLCANLTKLKKDWGVPPYFKVKNREQKHSSDCLRIREIQKYSWTERVIHSKFYSINSEKIKLNFSIEKGLQALTESMMLKKSNKKNNENQSEELTQRIYTKNLKPTEMDKIDSPKSVKTIKNLVDIFEETTYKHKIVVDKNDKRISIEDIFLEILEGDNYELCKPSIFYGRAWINKYPRDANTFDDVKGVNIRFSPTINVKNFDGKIFEGKPSIIVYKSEFEKARRATDFRSLVKKSLKTNPTDRLCTFYILTQLIVEGKYVNLDKKFGEFSRQFDVRFD